MKKKVLLVCGSRSVKLESSFYEIVADRAIANNWHIIAGDCYAGVDNDLARVTSTHPQYTMMKPFMLVYGIQETPRHKHMSEQVKYQNVGEICKTFTERDEFMVGQAQYIYAIWDGKSKGTKHVIDYAVVNGFQVGVNLWIKAAS